MAINRLSPVVVALALALNACGASESSSSTEPSPAPSPSAAESSPGASFNARGLLFELPAGWVAETPSSSMRIFQASVPGSGGPGQLSMFHFGVGGGGGVEANLQRWIGQMADTAGDPERMVFERGDLKVTWIDLSGTLKASTIGSFPQTDQPDYRLFGAVVEGGQGPWFIRAIGPEATLGEQRAAFVSMLESVRAEIGSAG